MPVRRPTSESPSIVAAKLREAALRRRHERGGRSQGLRLTGEARGHASRVPPLHDSGHLDAPAGQTLRGEGDARWVLAVRVATDLEGAILSPEKRDRLVRLGKTMGLTPFDANLVIAIIQDQARRGVLADYCPQAAAAQLAMVPAPRGAVDRGWRAIAATAAALAAVQAAFFIWLLA